MREGRRERKGGREREYTHEERFGNIFKELRKIGSHSGLNWGPRTSAVSALPPELWPPGDSQPSQFSISLCMCCQNPARDRHVHVHVHTMYMYILPSKLHVHMLLPLPLPPYPPHVLHLVDLCGGDLLGSGLLLV